MRQDHPTEPRAVTRETHRVRRHLEKTSHLFAQSGHPRARRLTQHDYHSIVRDVWFDISDEQTSRAARARFLVEQQRRSHDDGDADIRVRVLPFRLGRHILRPRLELDTRRTVRVKVIQARVRPRASLVKPTRGVVKSRVQSRQRRRRDVVRGVSNNLQIRAHARRLTARVVDIKPQSRARHARDRRSTRPIVRARPLVAPRQRRRLAVLRPLRRRRALGERSQSSPPRVDVRIAHTAHDERSGGVRTDERRPHGVVRARGSKRIQRRRG